MSLFFHCNGVSRQICFILSSVGFILSDDSSYPVFLKNLCAALFYISEWSRSISLLDSHAGKHVESVQLDGKPAVLKASVLSVTALTDSERFRPEIIKDWIVANYAPFVPEEFLEKVSLNGSSSILFALLQQEEFFYLSLLPFLRIKGGHFPAVFGVCGNSYVVERVPEIINEQFIMQRTWMEVLPVIRGLFALAKDLAAVSLELCDVKLGNLGWNALTQTVVVLDCDSMYFTGLLEEQFEGRPCKNDEDCSIFHCKGSCNMIKRTCKKFVSDDNLARICRNLFRPGFMERGLFSSAPLSSKPRLYGLANRCGGGGSAEAISAVDELRLKFYGSVL